MVECTECSGRDVEVVYAPAYESDVTVECKGCGHKFQVTKQDLEDEFTNY